MSTLQSQVNQVRSIDWKTATRVAVEFVGRMGIILSASMIYALFIAVVSEIVPLEEFNRRALQLVEFALGAPLLALGAAAATRVANYIADTDVSELRAALLAVGVALIGQTTLIYLMGLGVV